MNAINIPMPESCSVCPCFNAAIDAVPIKDISTWLAGYAAPPKYALEMFPESERCLANTMAAAWEHHIRTMIECGLIGKINEKKEE